MADNDLSIPTAAGNRTLGGKDASGVYHEAALVESLSDSGAPQYASNATPVPVGGPTLEEIATAIHILTTANAGQLPDSFGRTRVSVDAGTLVTVTNLTKLINYGTVPVPADLGMYAVPMSIRQGIVVS